MRHRARRGALAPLLARPPRQIGHTCDRMHVLCRFDYAAGAGRLYRRRGGRGSAISVGRAMVGGEVGGWSLRGYLQ